MMMGNTFGEVFRFSSFGESHGVAIGGVVDGVPSGVELDLELIQRQLDRRRPGQSKIVSQRKENDKVEILSGVFQGVTTGMPIGFVIRNNDQKPQDYQHLKNIFRPSHADFTYSAKYGHRDYTGGGRASARETATRVVAGAIARQILPQQIKVTAYSSAVGQIEVDRDYKKLDFSQIEKNPVRCPDEKKAQQMQKYIEEIRAKADSTGGVVTCVIEGVPVGLGEPVFGRLDAQLAGAMLSINATKGFEYGSGFYGSTMTGSQHNDIFNEDFTTKTNFSGGIQGGISNGMDIYFRVAFKPVATIMKEQETVDINSKKVILKAKGRHDPCVVPRAVPIVEAMTWIVLADSYLISKIYKK